MRPHFFRGIISQGILCLGVSMCIAFFPAQGQDQNISASPSTETWKKFRTTGFEIQYPGTWELDTAKVNGPAFVLYGRQAIEMKFRENINLMTQDLRGLNLDLNSYAEISEQQIRNALPNGSIIESKQMTSGGDHYHQIIYAGDFSGHKLKWIQHYRIVNEIAYVLTFTAAAETYDTFIPVAAKVMNSFRLTSN